MTRSAGTLSIRSLKPRAFRLSSGSGFDNVQTAKFSILVNGEPAGFFEGRKSLRQGDPLSPYLFILVMEALSKLLDAAAREGKFGLHPQCQNPLLTHLLFADDLLLFSDGSTSSMVGISEVLSQFKSMSGLDMNAA